MAYYNARLIKYADGEYQLRLYDNGVYSGDPYTDEQLDVLADNRALESEIARLEGMNPFDAPAKVVDEFVERSEEDIEKCIRSSLNRTRSRLYEYVRANSWEWFFTFTFDSETERYDYDACRKKISKFLNHVRERLAPDLKYIIVPEEHTKGEKNEAGLYAWHFHALVSNVGEMKFSPAVNNAKMWNDKPNKYYGMPLLTYYPDGDPVYNVASYKLGFSTATKIRDSSRAAMYVVKYMTKEVCQRIPGKQRFSPSRNLDLPERSIWSDDAVMRGDLVSVINRLCDDLNAKVTHTKRVCVTNEGYDNAITYIELKTL